jgi:hypothetical protein
MEHAVPSDNPAIFNAVKNRLRSKCLKITLTKLLNMVSWVVSARAIIVPEGFQLEKLIHGESPATMISFEDTIVRFRSVV